MEQNASMPSYDDHWSKLVKKQLTSRSNLILVENVWKHSNSRLMRFWRKYRHSKRRRNAMRAEINAAIAVANYQWLESVRQQAPRFVQFRYLWHLSELRTERTLWLLDER